MTDKQARDGDPLISMCRGYFVPYNDVIVSYDNQYLFFQALFSETAYAAGPSARDPAGAEKRISERMNLNGYIH